MRFGAIGSANKASTTMIFENTARSYYDFFDGKKIKIGTGAGGTHIAAWGSPKGIDCFAWVTAHENKHHVQITVFWPSGWVAADDGDSDWLKDSQEPNYMPGRPYDPTKDKTYPDTIGYGENPLHDIDDICMRTQTAPYGLHKLWTNGGADQHDWAYPGKNSKNPF